MDIRRMKNECDNCNCKEDNDLVILTIANEIIILCPSCLRELKDLSSSLIVTTIMNKNK